MCKTQQSGFTEIAITQSSLVYLYLDYFCIAVASIWDIFVMNFDFSLFFFLFPQEDSSFTLLASEMKSSSSTLYFLRPYIVLY